MKAKIESESISVKEYERAVVFRLGRLLTGGARGPGVFFIIPCVDIYEKIDMRTATYEIPPQEVFILSNPTPTCKPKSTSVGLSRS